MTPEHAAWLDLVHEEVLLPELAICDPHHHLWDHPKERYLVEELHQDTGSGHNVMTTVYVDCMSGYRTDGPEELRPVGETEFALGQARASEAGGAVIGAIVSYADLRLGAGVEAVLAAHVAAGDGRFRGIRHATSRDADPSIRSNHVGSPAGLMGTPAFRQGLGVLAAMGLSYDAWLYHPQIPELVRLARDFPNVQMVCDHLGGPLGVRSYAGRRAEVLAATRESLRELAACPNVALKLGGIGMAIMGDGWHRRERPPSSAELAGVWGDFVRWCVETFGAERCMFESNFPVDRASCSYVVLWNAFKRMVHDASEDEKAALFLGTARRVYRIAS